MSNKCLHHTAVFRLCMIPVLDSTGFFQSFFTVSNRYLYKYLRKIAPFSETGCHSAPCQRQALRNNIKFSGACKKKNELGEGDPQKKRELEAMISGDPVDHGSPPTHTPHSPLPPLGANKCRQAVSVSRSLQLFLFCLVTNPAPIYNHMLISAQGPWGLSHV